MSERKRDQLMDHDADGIKEYDNDLPRWWLYGFYLTIACAMLYMFYYHFYSGADWNVLWYKSRGQVPEYNREVAAAKPLNAGLASTTEAATIEYVMKTDAAALKRGEEIFTGNTNLCFTCHRADLGGVVGPNLTDEYWIHGGRFKDIVQSIKTGYPDKGMMPYGSNAKLSDEDVVNIASFIMSKKDSHPAAPKPIDPTREKKVEDDDQDSQDHDAKDKGHSDKKDLRPTDSKDHDYSKHK